MNFSTAIPLPPVLGPRQRGFDSVQEIIAIVQDIAELPPAEQAEHLQALVIAYPASALADTLLCIAHGFALTPPTAHQVPRSSFDEAPP